MDSSTGRERLVARHMAFGRAPEAARTWVAATDEPNAELVEASRDRADFVARWPG